MIEIQPPYEPLYSNKDKFITLITGGRGSAKSFNGMTFVQRLLFEKGHKILLTRYTMSSAAISVIPEFTEKVELEGTQNYFKITEKDAVNLMSGSEVMFRGIKTSSGNQTANLKSIQGLTTFVVDEGEEWTDEEDYDKLVLSVRQKGIQNRIIIIMNPTDINHFVYRKYIQNSHKIVETDGVEVQLSTHPNVLHIHTSYLDNISNLSLDFLDNIEELREKALRESVDNKGDFDQAKFNSSKYARVVIGRWADMSEGAVFRNWGLVDEIPSYVKKRGIGLDFGYTNDPTAIVECGLHDGVLYLDELCYRTRMRTAEIIDELKPLRMRVISESADPRLVDEIHDAGVNIHPVNKGKREGKSSIIAGIEKMQSFEIKVTRRSKNIQDELRTHIWAKDKNGIALNEPEDKNNHAIDAARYWVLEEVMGGSGGLTLEEMFG